MNGSFFLVLLCFLALPPLISKLLKVEKVFPLVFVQLVLGLLINFSGLDERLRSDGVNLTSGPLAESLHGLGLVGVSILIALMGGEAAPRARGLSAWKFVPVSVCGFFSTALLGSAIGYQLGNAYPQLLGPNSDLPSFALSVGLALSVTALPVLLSILRQTGLQSTPVGLIAANSALLDDLWLWLGMAGVLSQAAGHTSSWHTLLFLALYLTVMLLAVRPLLRFMLVSRAHGSVVDRMLLTVSLTFLSAFATDMIGLHPIFGAFVAGAVLPREALEGWRESTLNFIHVALLPFFFILTGLHLKIDINAPLFWHLTIMLTLAAVGGKFCSVALVAKLTGFKWKDSLMLGCLMQCKGLMELVAINILLDTGMISLQVFSSLAMMALISTLLTAPAIHVISRYNYRQATQELAETDMNGFSDDRTSSITR